LYELASHLHRAIETGNPRAIEHARRNLSAMLDMAAHGALGREMITGPEDEEALMFLRHFVHRLDSFIPKPKPARKGRMISEPKE
jgi:hypothetical protein